MTKNLFAFAFTALLLAACSKPKPADLAGQTMYLTSVNLHNSPYVQMPINFTQQSAEIFEIKSFHPMYGDVITGDYIFTGDKLSLPQLGAFTVSKTNEGYNLYTDGKLTYRLGKKMLPFINAGSTAPQHQSQFASAITMH